MTVYVDDMRLPVRAGTAEVHWSQLVADTDAELHAFAARIGISRHWVREPDSAITHYDVTETMRRRALAAGAVPIGYLSAERAALIGRRRASIQPLVDPRVAASLARSRSVEAHTAEAAGAGSAQIQSCPDQRRNAR